MGIFDGLLVKYGATIVSYYVLAKPSLAAFYNNNKTMSIS